MTTMQTDATAGKLAEMHPWEKVVGITLAQLRRHQQREFLWNALDELLDRVARLFRKPGGQSWQVQYDEAIAFLNEVLGESHFCDYHLREKEQ